MLNLKNFLKSLFKNDSYISELDQFLRAFDKSCPQLSKSQLYERNKYKRIYQLRDNKIKLPNKNTLWDKF